MKATRVSSFKITSTLASPSDESGAVIYLFRFLPSDDKLELKESQLDLILDLAGLIDALQSIDRVDRSAR